MIDLRHMSLTDFMTEIVEAGKEAEKMRKEMEFHKQKRKHYAKR